MAAPYLLGRRLGQGAFGEVFEAQDIMGHTVAVKILKLDNSDQERAADKELKPLLKLEQTPHEHILPFLDHYYENNNLCLVLEYCQQGTLNDLLLRQSWNETIELRLMAEIADGVNFLHNNNIVHRDLKPDNILIAGSEETPVVKVGDFGLAKICGQGEGNYLLSDDSNYYMYDYCGSKAFMAPEILGHKHYTCLCDVFSMGVIFVAMVERTSVPSPSYKQKFVALVEDGPIGIAQNRSENFSLEDKILQGLAHQPFKSLCLSMLNKRYNDRPSARRVLDKIRRVRHVVPRNRRQTRPVPHTPQNNPAPYIPQSTQVKYRPQNNPEPHTPQPRQATRRRPQPVIVLGAVGVGAVVGYRFGGPLGAVGGAILGLAVGIFFFG